MIQDKKKFINMITNMFYFYFLLIIIQVILYFNYPQFFNIYDTMFKYIYKFFMEFWDFFSDVLMYIINNFTDFFMIIGILIL